MKTAFTATVGYRVHELGRLINHQYDRSMSELGLTRAQWWVLAALNFNNGVTQSELAAELGFSKAALGLTLDRLEKKGWLKRRAHPQDRRARCVFRTAKATTLLARMQGIALTMNRKLEAGLTRAERASLVRMLNLVRNNLTDD